MTSLQTLHNVVLNEEGVVELIRGLGKLKQLRKLGLVKVTIEHGSALCTSINDMQHLEKLYIQSYQVIDWHFISFPSMLRVLCMDGNLNKLSGWVPKLQNLVKLHLASSMLTDDPLKSLQKMPNLLSLYINYNAYEGESLHFQDGRFQKLKELYLHGLFNLNSIIIDRGALPSLERLQFQNIPELKTIPSGIQHLERLEVLNIYDMPTEFNKINALNGGPKYPLIKHVTIVELTRTIKLWK